MEGENRDWHRLHFQGPKLDPIYYIQNVNNMLEFSCGYFITFLVTKYGVPFAHCSTTVPQARAHVSNDSSCSSTHGSMACIFTGGELLCKLQCKVDCSREQVPNHSQLRELGNKLLK